MVCARAKPTPVSSVADVRVKKPILTISPIAPAVIERVSHGVFPYSFESVAINPTEIRGISTIKIFPSSK